MPSDSVSIVSPELEAKRARMAKARAAAQRNAAERRAAKRTAADSAPPPMTAERAEPPREVSLPETHLPTRRGRFERVNGLDLAPHEKKPGWDYQWIAVRVLNQPIDRSRIRDFEDNGGWRVVTAGEIPTRAERGASSDSPIEQEGCMLYTRPMSLTMEARQEDIATAYQQQYDRMKAAASGNSAVRGEEGIPNRRGVVKVPVEIAIVGEAG